MAEEMTSAPASGQGATVSNGTEQPAITSDKATAPESTGSNPEPFFVYDWGDEKQSFGTQDELKSYIKDGTLRHKDYTRKNQERSEKEKKLASDRERFDAEYTTFLKTKERHDKIDAWLKTLSPDMRARLEGEVRSSRIDPETAKIREELDSLKKAEEQRKTDAEKAEKDSAERERVESAHTRLGKRYTDYNRKAIDDYIRSIQESPDQLYALYETVHNALKVRTPSGPSHQGGSPQGGLGGPTKKYASLEEAKAAAMSEYGR